MTVLKHKFTTVPILQNILIRHRLSSYQPLVDVPLWSLRGVVRRTKRYGHSFWIVQLPTQSRHVTHDVDVLSKLRRRVDFEQDLDHAREGDVWCSRSRGGSVLARAIVRRRSTLRGCEVGICNFRGGTPWWWEV